MTDRAARRAAAAAGAALLLVYLATLAPDVTFWDAGEFIAAIESWGIPHPPGTPLYVTLGRAWRLLVGFLSPAVAANALSALSTAAACALLGALIGRRALAPRLTAAATTIGAGVVASAWLNATEAEVYAPSLLLGATMLFVADLRPERGVRKQLLLVYLFGLAAPLHASALVAAPGAIALAAGRIDDRSNRLRVALVLAVSFVAAAAFATGRTWLALAGLGALAVLAALRVEGAAGAIPALALGASPLAIMLLRAQFDPAVNQGNPATIATLLDVLARKQYAVAPLWPRQAPPWLQLANFFQYADWQYALGLAPGATFSAPRLAIALVYVALGVAGARAHARMDRRSFRALLVLLLSASVGVAAYLNLKAGPSIGWGILPDSAPHEARERDYFFVLAFWTWGAWAALGGLEFARAVSRGRWPALGLAFALLPIATNWRAMDRRREPDAGAAIAIARAHLAPLPRRAVLVTWGDNDSYPLWYAQRALHYREDVTIVTAPLLGAGWYQDELWRRDSIPLQPGADESGLVARVAAGARARRRPVAFAPGVAARVRRATGDDWSMCGIVWLDAGATCHAPPNPPTREPNAHSDPVVRMMLPLLRCGRLSAPASLDSLAKDSLAVICNVR
ncbi:MAG TPA: DUF2723 domain-containing protein [Gemmatimonadaceae bacterium]|nr:DUF2723 domain-containing protein [Gemmatimonadaceae bacterium]